MRSLGVAKFWQLKDSGGKIIIQKKEERNLNKRTTALKAKESFMKEYKINPE